MLPVSCATAGDADCAARRPALFPDGPDYPTPSGDVVAPESTCNPSPAFRHCVGNPNSINLSAIPSSAVQNWAVAVVAAKIDHYLSHG